MDNSWYSKLHNSASTYIIHPFSSLWDKNNLNNKFDKKMLELSSCISNLDNNIIDTPSMVVVGTQSSGKSSVLNSIMRMDLLPTGSVMTTRCPIILNLRHNSNVSIIFSYKKDSIIEKYDDITLASDLPNEEESNLINEKLLKMTKIIAGDNQNISYNSIILDLYSPNTPNLTLIDLPGLTMTALTDKGQPADIKQQIINLIETYTKNPKTIILGIFPARPDIEADPSLEIIKNYKNKTIGILTKVDLMNNDKKLLDYIHNNISKDLHLGFGYFAIKNRSPDSNLNILDGINDEKLYFDTHNIYKNCNIKQRLGITNLSNYLSSILLEMISQNIPELLQNVNQKITEINSQLSIIGTPIPDIENDKLNIISNTLVSINNHLSILLDSKQYNIARLINDCFNNFRNNLSKTNPFEHIDDNKIKDISKNVNGLHMSLGDLNIYVFEQIIYESNINKILYDNINQCIQNNHYTITNHINCLLKDDIYMRFPKLNEKIYNEFINICNDTRLSCIELCKNIIDSELSFVNAENFKFTNKITNDLHEYYKIIISHIGHILPKIILHNFIKYIIKNSYQILHKNITDISLICEDNEITNKRRYLQQNLNTLNKTLNILRTF